MHNVANHRIQIHRGVAGGEKGAVLRPPQAAESKGQEIGRKTGYFKLNNSENAELNLSKINK
jgi:hypothetical protein